MPTKHEKAAFAQRLKDALRHGAKHGASPVKGATQLANQFNLRFQGNGVTPQTAHKWLTGRSIPTSDKIEAMAAWLGVSARWLHHGPAPAMPFVDQQGHGGDETDTNQPSPEMWALVEKIHLLSLQRRHIVEQLVIEFIESES